MLKLIISLFELTGGNDMLRTNIVVGLGFTISGEKPSNRVTVSRKKRYREMGSGSAKLGSNHTLPPKLRIFRKAAE